MISIKEVKTTKEYEIAKTLFKEYVALLGVDLSFQNFQEELENIAVQYSKPDGVLFIAYQNEQTPVACFGVRKLTTEICELKRMYVRKEARGIGLGSQLLTKSFEVGQELGYQKMRLDTLPTMGAAIKLYTKAGFYEISAYRFNPIIGTKFMEKVL